MCTSQEIPLYFHVAMDHMPQMIIDHGDLRRLGCDNLEHIHSIRAGDFKCGSNKKNGKKGSGQKGRLYQTLRLEVVRHKLNRILPYKDFSRFKQESFAKKRKAS